MTDTDPYAGIRTRDNIVEVDAEFQGGSFEELQRLISGRWTTQQSSEIDNQVDAVTRPPGRSQRRNIVIGQPILRSQPRPPAPTPQSAFVEEPSRAYEQNLVPAEDVPAHERIAQLKKLVEDMFADWCKLNEIYNITAKQRDWCTDYEERQANYNEQFKVLRLVGRPNNWYGSTSNWKTLDGSDYGHD